MAYQINHDTYTQIAARLNDWLECSGGSVSNLALDLLNRAQRNLQQYLPWDYLVKRSALTVTNKRANLPSDCGQILDIYHDSDGDGRPDYHYFQNGAYSDNGFVVENSFTVSSGHSLAIAFYSAPTNTPYIAYQATLADFAGTGTEYSYFPGDLLLIEAMYIHITEMGQVGPEYQSIVARREELLRDYRQAHQGSAQDQRMVQNDIIGDPIEQSGYAMDGSIDGVTTDRHSPSYDRGF